jgi:hypothetical protein
MTKFSQRLASGTLARPSRGRSHFLSHIATPGFMRNTQRGTSAPICAGEISDLNRDLCPQFPNKGAA